MGVVFIDCETTGLDPERHEIWEIGLLDANGHEWRCTPEVDRGTADAVSLDIGEFYTRYPINALNLQMSRARAAREVERLTRGHHIAGAVISFDAAFLTRFLRANNATPGWHYHIIDVEAIAAGRLGLAPPWKSDELSRAVGVDPGMFERHTALGDALWARAIYDACIVTPEPF